MTTKTILLCAVVVIISIACKPTVSTEKSSEFDTISCGDSIYLNSIDSIEGDSVCSDSIK